MYSLSTLSEAWSAFRYFLQCMCMPMEEPARLAARVWIKAELRDEILKWLAPLERMARLLLLAEAATLTLHPPRPRKPSPRREVKGSRLRPVPEDSEDWRVAFKVAAKAKRRRRIVKRAPKRAFAPTVYDSVPLAARIEALIRVALDPVSCARRLARRLSKQTLSRRQTRRLFRPARLDQHRCYPFEHAMPAFMEIAAPARIRFESG